MVTINNERVGKALELLRAGLGPFVKRELMNADGAKAYPRAGRLANTPVTQWDTYALLKQMKDTWHDVFGNVLSPADKHLVHELSDQRNNWAHPTHQNSFSIDDAYECLIPRHGS